MKYLHYHQYEFLLPSSHAIHLRFFPSFLNSEIFAFLLMKCNCQYDTRNLTVLISSNGLIITYLRCLAFSNIFGMSVYFKCVVSEDQSPGCTISTFTCTSYVHLRSIGGIKHAFPYFEPQSCPSGQMEIKYIFKPSKKKKKSNFFVIVTVNNECPCP